MLPITAGAQHTATQILIYSLLLVGASIAPCALGAARGLYAAIALLLNAALIWRAVSIWRLARNSAADLSRPAMKLFGFSILYLFAIYAMLLAGAQ
jgi:protoheme IX farnesyltransferase